MIGDDTCYEIGERRRPTVSAIVCTHNPHADHFAETLDSIRRQEPLGTGGTWELLIIDNASKEPLAARIDLSWRPDARVIREDTLGLAHARLRSFREARGDILVYIDDDNILEPNYLVRANTFMGDNERYGAIGGKVLPRYETAPPGWFAATGLSLACRDLGPSPMDASWRDTAQHRRIYPDCAPIGAGMVLRRSAYAAYIKETTENPARLTLGRRGLDLASGEDNDMVMTILKHGWSVGYRPELSLTHIIPSGRLDENYLRRYAYSSNRTWVQVLGVHGIRPWKAIQPATAFVRKARAYWRSQPWRGPAEQIAWAGACGLIDGRARLHLTSSD
jgi:glycosyltransferase involved in cell wall biosynthesis